MLEFTINVWDQVVQDLVSRSQTFYLTIVLCKQQVKGKTMWDYADQVKGQTMWDYADHEWFLDKTCTHTPQNLVLILK